MDLGQWQTALRSIANQLEDLEARARSSVGRQPDPDNEADVLGGMPVATDNAPESQGEGRS